MGVAIVNGLALHAHRASGVHATQLTEAPRQIYAATYGDPPDPPATTTLIEILAATAKTLHAPASRSRTSTDQR
jgi:hypothetical protein